MIDKATIDRIFDAADIVDVVSEFVTLRKRGVNYWGLCPFHDDKSPSFSVSPSKNICKCFACGEGGTAVQFIMKHEQLSYHDALLYLAKKYNIEVHERELTDKEKQARNDRDSMFIVNAWAQKYFTSILDNHIDGQSIGRRYFAERGFREETIRKFQLGYSLASRDALYQEAIKNGYKKEYLEKTGLVIAHQDGGVTDRFQGRVMFPIHTLSGKIVAFGGRILKRDEKRAKYMNSPESEIYHKSNELYGIYFAKKAIVKADRCFLVEGYTDVISMHQSGVENVVASSGTALTLGQIRLIHRFTNNITVLYDGDAAGIKAAIRGIDLLLAEGMNVKVVLLPDGEDPDSFARSHSVSEFSAFIQENETDFIRFKTKLLMEEAGNDPIKLSELSHDIINTIAIVPDNITRSIYIRECSAKMMLREQDILNEVNQLRLSRQENNRQPGPGAISTGSFSNRGLLGEDIPLRTSQENGESADVPPNFPPPPEEEGYRSDGDSAASSTPPPTVVPPEAEERKNKSPFEMYELALMRYIVRYGERVLFDYVDDETEQRNILHVANYIRRELETDNIRFYTPILQQMLDEAADHCEEDGFVAWHYFRSHSDLKISRIASELMSEKYQLSKYHSKFCKLDEEVDKLDQIVDLDILAFKDAYILKMINDKNEELRNIQSDDVDKTQAILRELVELNEIKKELSKRLGERIIVKM